MPYSLKSGSIQYEVDSEKHGFFVAKAWYDVRGGELKFGLAIWPKNHYRFEVSLGVVGFDIAWYVF